MKEIHVGSLESLQRAGEQILSSDSQKECKPADPPDTDLQNCKIMCCFKSLHFFIFTAAVDKDKSLVFTTVCPGCLERKNRRE